MEAKIFPKLVDEPPNILFWSADEIAPLFAGVALGMVLDAMLPCFGVAFVYTRIMRRYRNANLNGFVLHMIW
jgi:conjugal transfer pilus assembly protein TraL